MLWLTVCLSGLWRVAFWACKHVNDSCAPKPCTGQEQDCSVKNCLHSFSLFCWLGLKLSGGRWCCAYTSQASLSLCFIALECLKPHFVAFSWYCNGCGPSALTHNTTQSVTWALKCEMV